MSRSSEMGAQNDSALGRLIAFSDGIFAVAITLLVLAIAVPDLGNDQTDANLQNHLLDAIPSVISFVISFLVVGIFWLSHHRMFQIIEDYGRPTLYANLFFLMTICFVPFPTGIVTHYGQLASAVVFYASSMALGGLSLALLWWVAVIRPATDRPHRRMGIYFGLRAVGMSTVFLASIPLAVVNVGYARFAWFAIVPLYVVLGRLFGREVLADLRPSI
jgi:uncharacterized membrane protein